MPLKPRLVDIFGPDKPKRRKPFVTHDGNAIAPDDSDVTDDPTILASCRGDPLRIAGKSLATDERPKPSRAPVSFDGAVPSLTKIKDKL